MKKLVTLLLSLANVGLAATKKNFIIDTDLFSDVDDAGALLLAATSPDVNLLAVNVNYPSSFSALAASALLSHYGKAHVPIGSPRPLTNATFFDRYYFDLGEYASKVAYHYSGGSLPWGHADNAWDPVALYRKVLAEAEDGSVTIASIGFLDNLSALLNSTADASSPLSGRDLVSLKVSELVVMGGSYPSGGPSWNFFGSNASLAAHVVNTWTGPGRMVFAGDDVGKHALTGGPLMAEGPEADPVGRAYIWYGYHRPRPSWDPLAVWYAIHGLGKLFEYGNEGGSGYNFVEADGSNRWVADETVRNQFFLRLKVANETAAEEIDRLFLEGALLAASGRGTERAKQSSSLLPCRSCHGGREEL
ncbi:inosine/uridine-preferring nucleoside hydrolase [Parathielavia hyrcaniae]|uniref:Inosine/uridine-preferring nucleoside hydrolase n=1 Tax=Parathielavia hyrcaniae TaxID=113614 RepID=A0AAN6T3C1_9PEZI|nr:inosine/uridine-preferring nucleoside hydrolase [Parathielavia hyrcaniae]